VCLLVVAAGVVPGAPLLIGANRDEVLDRPATPVTVLQAAGPRILGGRDARAGGTWLAVNEHGVFAGLTNQPLGDQRDPTRRSRGELPLALAAHPTAEEAVTHFLPRYRPADYNGCWLVVGDRRSLFYLDFTGLVEPRAVALPPGIHVLENRPLEAPSPKAERVRTLLGGLDGSLAAATATLVAALADHWVPDPPTDPPRLPNCVHLETYGTRSSCLVTYGDGLPRLDVAPGPPCTTPFADASALWDGL
jgi:uncharacterized protein with NRDE domain